MTQRTKKVLFSILIATIMVFLAFATFLFYARTDTSAQESANASPTTWEWRPEVRKRVQEGNTINCFEVIRQSFDINASEDIAFVVRIENLALENSIFRYCESKEKDYTQLGNVAWPQVLDNEKDGGHSQVVEEEGKQVKYIWVEKPANASFDGFVHFCREYGEVENGSTIQKTEYYEFPINLTYNVTSSSYKPEIVGVKAFFPDGRNYDGSWTAQGLNFEVSTGLMKGGEKFDASKEKLSYSVDNQKNWIPAVNNIIEIKNRELNKVSVFFRLTGLSETEYSFYEYGADEHSNEHKIGMDPYSPEFNVVAETADKDMNTIAYDNNSWTSKPVMFSIMPLRASCSGITYQVSVGNGEYRETSDITQFTTSTSLVRFRAINGAKTAYDYGTVFNVNIDAFTPNVNLGAITPDPNDESKKKELKGENIDSTISFGYANGGIEIFVYNRDASGEPIDNASGTIFQYQFKDKDGYGGNWAEMNKGTTSATGEKGYVLDVKPKRDAIKDERTVKFRITSKAGLVSKEAEATFVLLKSAYLIELGDITAEKNFKGWIADKAVVRISVPTDSKRGINGVYSKPTVEYDFYYRATKGGEKETRAKGKPLEFDSEKEGEVRWWYSFDLVASADSTFTIYAKNRAGKASANKVTTKEPIKIDVLPPEYVLTAYIHSTDTTVQPEDFVYLDPTNPGWINGQAVLLIKVRESVSGIYVREMKYSMENGEIVRDEVTGEIVWQPYEKNMESTTITEQEDGVEKIYRVFRVMIDIKDEIETNKNYIGTREYKYRIYTNSGKSTDVGFVANIDMSEVIGINNFTISSGKKGQVVEISGQSGQRYVDMADYGFSVCEETKIKFTSSIDREKIEDHYKIRYQLFDGKNKSGQELLTMAGKLPGEFFQTKLPNQTLDLNIPENEIGDLYVAIYIDSMARDFRNNFISGGPYVVKLHYDTRKLVIAYEYSIVDDNGATVESQAEQWVKGKLSVIVAIKTNEEGGFKLDSSYTFSYMLFEELPLIIPDEGWINAQNGEVIQGVGVGGDSYKFYLPFDKSSFNGYVAVSVCNGAGYRSKQDKVPNTHIMIDNTIPVVDDSIVYEQITQENYVEGLRGESEIAEIAGTNVEILSYYSTKEISYVNIESGFCSPIEYYYLPIGTTIDKLDYALADFKSCANKPVGFFNEAGYTTENSYAMVYYALYAKNEVGTYSLDAEKIGENIHLKKVYKFVRDPSSIKGSMQNDHTNGLYVEQTGMFTYLWKDEISIVAYAYGDKTASNEVDNYIMYQFSVDRGKTWFNYLNAGVEDWSISSEARGTNLIFSPDLFKEYEIISGNGAVVHPFENGVNEVFMFRARNKAGATKIYEGNIRIAMENVTPDFKIVTTDKNNALYDGGKTELTTEPKSWSDGPITVKIETLVMPASGITYMYYLEYSDGTAIISTAEEGTYGKRIAGNGVFSTDTLDGFNINRDAVLTITALSNSAKRMVRQRSVRIAVDQVVPEFYLTGQAVKQHSSLTPTILSSGQWTNRDTVKLSKSKQVQNVSEVEYRYIKRNKDSTSVDATEIKWGDSVGSLETQESCTYTVIAISKSGLRYVRDFVVNIDTTAPQIRFDGGMNVIDGEEYFIDLKVMVDEANIDICEYITIKEETRGFAFNPNGYILSTSSVDNSTRYEKETGKEYRGFVRVYVKDYAGNEASISFYVLPFRLTVNNLTLTDEDLAQVREYADHLTKAKRYMETSRIGYFENLISRLNDRENTLRKEIKEFQDYLEKVYNRTSFELRSDYEEMYKHAKTYTEYKDYGKEWMQSAITGDSTSKYYAYFQNFKTQFGKLKALMDEVANVQNHAIALPAINMVEREDYEDILRVFDEYKNLTMDQKACFIPNLYNKLTDLKKSCEALLLTDAKLGVEIDGDFAPGATINVTQFADTTDTYTNAQASIATSVQKNKPRTVVSVHRISLDGAYAQTSASDITVTLPIKEEFRNYIYFSVYELSDDGTVKLVDKTEIMPDGKSVRFNTDALTTYVLCVKAEMEHKKPNTGQYGTILGLELDTKMIKYLIIIGASLFGILLLVVIVLGIRHRRFLNSYNKAYRHSIYRKGVKGVPKGNKFK